MHKLAIVYYSGTGNTEIMANAIAASAKKFGTEVQILTADNFGPDSIDLYDSIAFGCPSMGVENLEEEVFEPMFSSIESKLKGKPIALFGSYGWGEGQWMEDWEERVKADGAILLYSPIIAQEKPDLVALGKCTLLGEILGK
ncbi:flavodoxin [uncultured Sphaerochaeta sp.]|uniref:flavodoxin n=1 Tax=uncultured Sphaerochaeta sp. TaxID=886478 RepID=UPI002A0A3B40|nr:flavodoxin [uncultured Sphaerochaeta sp.]